MYSNLYKKKEIDMNVDINRYIQQKGFIKKKKGNKLMGMASGSDKVFMQFHLKGRCLVIYDDTADEKEKPEKLLYLTEINGIDKTVDNKDTHF